MSDAQTDKRSGSGTIFTTAAITGGVAFVARYIGPILFSDSNLGPLLGIFVTGPLGFLLGILIGVLISARQKSDRSATAELRWLGAAWLGAILFTFASTIGGIHWLTIAAQLSVVLCAVIVFYFTRVQLPVGVKKTRPAILAGAAVILASSTYPPLESRSSKDPAFAFFLDERFDASTRVPDYTVDSGALLIAWLLIAALVGLLILTRSAGGAQPD